MSHARPGGQMPSSRTPAGEMPADSLSASGPSASGQSPAVNRRGRSADSGPQACEELARAFDSGLIVAGSPEARAIVTGRRGRDRDGRPGFSTGMTGESGILSSGFPALDGLLPAGGVRPGRLVELLLAEGCAGGMTLACAVAMHVAAAGDEGHSPNGRGLLVVVDRFGDFHPPSVFGWNDWRRCQLVVARPSRDEDEIWTIDQALRCPGVGAVLSWPRRVHPTSMRRWQLAVRRQSARLWGRSDGFWSRGMQASSVGGAGARLSGEGDAGFSGDGSVGFSGDGGVGLIVRPAADMCRPSWAEVRLLVESTSDGGASANVSAGSPAVLPWGMGGPGRAGGIRSIVWRITRLEGPLDSSRRTADVAMDLATGASVPVDGRDAPQESSRHRIHGLPRAVGPLPAGPCRESPEACA